MKAKPEYGKKLKKYIKNCYDGCKDNLEKLNRLSSSDVEYKIQKCLKGFVFDEVKKFKNREIKIKKR